MLRPNQIAKHHVTSEQQNRKSNMEVLMIEAAGRCLGFKTKQKEATIEFIGRKDVFVLLQPGYGKSVYYTTIPLIFDQLGDNIRSLVIVVSPLIALMKGQVECFKSKRLECCIFSIGCCSCNYHRY